MREVKTLPLDELKIAAADKDGPGEFEGRASTFGTIDSYGDTIDPGAYTDTIPEFLERGFIGWGHDWTDPIGFVTAAEERKDGLWVTGQFHSDSEAQKYRQRARERVESGKFMGLSIGFEPLEWEMRGIEESEDPIRALTKIKLYEVSLVAVPAERNSGVTTVKSGMPLNEKLETALAAVPGLVDHVEELASLRADEGRSLSAARIDQLAALAAAYDEASARLRGLIEPIDLAEPTEPEPPDEPLDELQAAVRAVIAEHAQRDAFYRGVIWSA